MVEQLQEFPEDWTRALAIVAHPDDLEYGAAAAIARWTGQGRHISYVLATRGEAGIDSMPPHQAGPVRVAEQVASAKIVGVNDVEFLNHSDGVIEYGLPLRRDIASAIRRYQPELIITINHHETWAGGNALNMADHIVVGRAVLDGVRDAANRWVFPELALEPHTGVRRVAIAGSPLANHAVDISETFETGVSSLQAHRAYLRGLGDHPMADAAGFLRMVAGFTAERFAGRLSTSFELVDM